MKRWLVLILAAIGITGRAQTNAPNPAVPLGNGESQVALVFSGGHDTDPRDHGRPVVLIAAALQVPADVFRDAFRHVHPAPAGEQPDPEQVRRNKEELLSRLAPYGVTDERLDEVSNYYRYRPGSGRLWPHADAAGFAVVRGGKIVSVGITVPGTGYTSPPKVTASVGLTEYPVAVLSYGTELTRNGSVLTVAHPPIGDGEVGGPGALAPPVEMENPRIQPNPSQLPEPSPAPPH